MLVVGKNGVEGLVRGETHELGMCDSAQIGGEVLALAGPGVEDGFGAWVFLDEVPEFLCCWEVEYTGEGGHVCLKLFGEGVVVVYIGDVAGFGCLVGGLGRHFGL